MLDREDGDSEEACHLVCGLAGNFSLAAENIGQSKMSGGMIAIYISPNKGTKSIHIYIKC